MREDGGRMILRLVAPLAHIDCHGAAVNAHHVTPLALLCLELFAGTNFHFLDRIPILVDNRTGWFPTFLIANGIDPLDVREPSHGLWLIVQIFLGEISQAEILPPF